MTDTGLKYRTHRYTCGCCSNGCICEQHGSTTGKGPAPRQCELHRPPAPPHAHRCLFGPDPVIRRHAGHPCECECGAILNVAGRWLTDADATGVPA